MKERLFLVCVQLDIVKFHAHRAGIPGDVDMITVSAVLPASKAGHPADLPVTNLSWSAFFGIILIDTIRLRSKVPRMDTIEHFSDFLRGIGAHNFLALGIAIIVLWLLISGLRKGLKKNKHDGERNGDDPTD